MYKLFWSEGTASFAPQIVLEEAGVEFDIVVTDTAKSEHTKPEFLAINPFGKIPALILPNGTIMTEAAAICLYLIEQHDLDHLAPKPKSSERAEFLRWIIYLTNTIQENYKRYYYCDRFIPEGGDIDGFRKIAIKDLIEFWKPVESALKKSNGAFMLGEKLCLLDIYITMLITWFQPMDELLSIYPSLKSCYDETNKNTSVAKCMKLQTKLSIGVV